MNKFIGWMTAAAIALQSGAALAAADPVDLLFNSAQMADVAAPAELVYTHTRQTDSSIALGSDLESKIVVQVADEQKKTTLNVVLDPDGAHNELGTFQDMQGNPMLMVFLENLVISISRATGGSPFYIRNRIKENFPNGTVTENGAVQEIVLHPFTEDKNREKLGAFADMEIRFTLDQNTPGLLRAMHAQTMPVDGKTAYEEDIDFVEMH